MIRWLQEIPTHAALLIVLLILIIVSPLVPIDRSAFILELLFDLVLLTGVHSVGPSRHRWPFLVLTVLTLGIRWGEELTEHGALDISALGITSIWLAYAIWIIVAHLFQRPTMGYGDIVPVSNLARPIAVLEGVFGQLYLAVMVARLVGLHIVHERRND